MKHVAYYEVDYEVEHKANDAFSNTLHEAYFEASK
jgi:hypothetical protein